MRIIAVNTLREYWAEHPDTHFPLYEWYFKVSRAEWESFNDMKRDFNTVEYEGNQRYVFHIKRRGQCLDIIVKLAPKLVCVRFIGINVQSNLDYSPKA